MTKKPKNQIHRPSILGILYFSTSLSEELSHLKEFTQRLAREYGLPETLEQFRALIDATSNEVLDLGSLEERIWDVLQKLEAIDKFKKRGHRDSLAMECIHLGALMKELELSPPYRKPTEAIQKGLQIRAETIKRTGRRPSDKEVIKQLNAMGIKTSASFQVGFSRAKKTANRKENYSVAP